MNSGKQRFYICSSALLIIIIALSSCFEQNLTPPRDECVCTGHLLQLNCTAVGIGTTVWRVDNQQCTRAIELDHLQYPGGITRSCSNAANAPTGRSLSVMDECYTSQLTVMITPDLNGTVINCEHDSGPVVEFIGNYSIILTSEPLPPPDDIRLTNITSDGLVFSWSSVSPNCSAVSYNISSDGCGDCPVNTTSTTATCRDLPLAPDMQTCELSVQTIVCGRIAGIHSNTLITRLPSAMSLTPTVNILPKYQQNTTLLTSFMIIIDKIAPILVSDVIVALEFFTVKYLIGGSVCESRMIELNGQTCIGNVCIVNSVISDSNCTVEAASDIVVTVSAATSGLGSGQEFQSELDGAYVNFISVTHENNSIVCTFVNQQDRSRKSCNATYAPCDGAQQSRTSYNTTSESRLVLNLMLSDQTKYCYTVNASNNTVSILIEGSIESGITGTTAQPSRENRLQVGDIVGIVIGSSVMILILAIIAITILCWNLRSKRTRAAVDKGVQLKEIHPLKQEDSKPQGHNLDGPNSEDIGIIEERIADAQEVQASQGPGVSQDTGPTEASIPSEEHHDARPRLELAERSESQQQLSHPEPQVLEHPTFRCPCGSCTVESYLRQGCPNGYFPYLELSTLTEDDREDLIQQLSEETKQIIDCFTNLIDSTCFSLKERGVTTEELARRVLELGTYTSPHIVQKPLMSEEVTELKNSKTIDESFLILQPHISFFNYELLNHIIEGRVTGSDEDRRKMEEYHEKFKQYCKRKIVEVPQDGNDQSSTNQSRREKFLVKYYIYEHQELRLEDVVAAKMKIATLLGLKSSTLNLHKIDEGSLILVFSVPKFVTQQLFPLSPEQIAALKKSGYYLYTTCDTDTNQATIETMCTNEPMAHQYTALIPEENQADDSEFLTGPDLEHVKKEDYKKYIIAEGCGLLEFFNKNSIEFCRGCTFYEFQNKAEDVHRNSRIILIDKSTDEYFSGEGARKMVGLLPSPEETEESRIEIEVEIERPDHLLEGYRIFIQDRGPGARYLPMGSTILVQDEVLEVVSKERFLWLPVTEDSELLTFIESQKHPHQDEKLVFHRGSAFYEFSHKSEDITKKKEVILMDVKSKTLYTGKRAKIMLGVPGKGIRNPFASKKKWRVFVQSSCTGNRHLDKDTMILYEKDKKQFVKSTPSTSSIYMEEVDHFEVIDVTENTSLRDYIKKVKGSHSYDRGCSYYELTDKEELYIYSDKAVILMDKNGKLHTGQAAAKKIRAPGVDLKNPGLSAYSRAFICCNGPGHNIFVRKGTYVLYKDPMISPDLIPVNIHDFYCFEVYETCELRKFVEKELENRHCTYKKGNAYFQFTCATEDIENDKEVLLLDEEGNLFTGSAARQLIGAPGIGIPKPDPYFEYTVFIQNRSRGSRCLIKGSRLYYKKD